MFQKKIVSSFFGCKRQDFAAAYYWASAPCSRIANHVLDFLKTVSGFV
jgi:hypothetical protein